MAFERVMGIYVSDNEEYQRYREGMIPILHSFGGSFGFDFKVSEVLLSKTDDAINRVFTIEFPSKEIMDAFFSNPEYLAVQKTGFGVRSCFADFKSFYPLHMLEFKSLCIMALTDIVGWKMRKTRADPDVPQNTARLSLNASPTGADNNGPVAKIRLIRTRRLLPSSTIPRAATA